MVISNPLLEKEFDVFYLQVPQVIETWNLWIFQKLLGDFENFWAILNILMNNMTSSEKFKMLDAWI